MHILIFLQMFLLKILIKAIIINNSIIQVVFLVSFNLLNNKN